MLIVGPAKSPPELIARVASIIAEQNGPSWDDDAEAVIAEVLAWVEREWVTVPRLD